MNLQIYYQNRIAFLPVDDSLVKSLPTFECDLHYEGYHLLGLQNRSVWSYL